MNATFKRATCIFIAFCILSGGLNAGLANEVRESDAFTGAVETQTLVFRVISLQDVSLKIAGFLLNETMPQRKAGAEKKQQKKDANRSSNYSLVSFEKRHCERMGDGNAVAALYAGSESLPTESGLLLNLGKLRSLHALKIYLCLHALMLVPALCGSGISGRGITAASHGIFHATQLRNVSWVSCFYGEHGNGGGIQ